MRRSIFLTAAVFFAFLSANAIAQPPGRGGFGGGDPRGGSRGGDPRGGFGGGDPRSRGGDDRGSSRGGFNPADMIRRFDRNGNDMIDPDEAQGPAQFFLQRMAQSNPKIDLSKPVPISLLTGEIEKMRGGGSSGGSSDSGSSRGSDEPQLLVPDFSLDFTPEPIPGFGGASALFAVTVEERDLKEAEERLRRYDRDRDGSLTPEELRSGRWSDDPMQYDRNRDGKLTKEELAVRYANRRVESEESSDSRGGSDSRSSSGWGRGGDSSGWSRGGDSGGWQRGSGRDEGGSEAEDRFGDAKSYRLTVRSSESGSGLPDFFARSDANGDGQVLMHEFSSSWNQETLAEFLKWDLNSDGIITKRECISALSGGARVASTGGSSSSSTGAATASTGASSSGGGASVSDVEMAWAKRQIGKYDSNSDGVLTANEWEKMIIKPTGADADGDGVITELEYAKFRAGS